MGFLTGKHILITGIASHRSIAYGVAQAMHREGAQLAFTYQHEKLKSRVEEVAASFGSKIVLLCDVTKDISISNLFICLAEVWPTFDGFIHAIAFAPSEQLCGDYVKTVTREGFSIAHEISAYSFVAMAKESQKMLSAKSSLVTLTYLGSKRVVPNYNVMGPAKASLEANTRYMASSMGPKGVRVNAISSGPIRTLAASGIKNFKKMLSHCESVAPIQRTVNIIDIGNVAAFLCSDLSAGITGEIIHVDGGFNITVMNESFSN
ncbi:SDR family oxidoreductase [Sodalis sp. CWE]|uniref:SDR family oxidoreductase n=1 Tax=Sodalis sp. CWE TaxID=2803816 RepID=UPI001C7D11B7|nr:SDR family oxidoreductase [Sodalis sp. CWE]MBX4181160.1 SDR family oxidoreductase [Sodalis sp. CWE]